MGSRLVPGNAKPQVVSWRPVARVADLEVEDGDLKSEGVSFEEYDLPDLKTVGSTAYAHVRHKRPDFEAARATCLGLLSRHLKTGDYFRRTPRCLGRRWVLGLTIATSAFGFDDG